MTDTHERSLAVSPEAIRRRLFTGAAVPPDLLNKALARLDQQLDAVKTELVTHKGEVKSRETMTDNAAVQGAIDKVLSMTGMYVKERDKVTQRDPVEVIVGPDGVVRIRVGGADSAADIAPALDSASIPALKPGTVEVLPSIEGEPPAQRKSAPVPVLNRLTTPILEDTFRILTDEEVD